MFTQTDITKQITKNKNALVTIIKINKLYHFQVTVTNDKKGIETLEIIKYLQGIYGGDIKYHKYVEYGFYHYSKAQLLNVVMVDEEAMKINLNDHYMVGSNTIKIGA